MGEGGESQLETNINYLLEEFGMRVNSDSVIRTSFLKYLKPKEVLVTDGILNRDISKELARLRKTVTRPQSGASRPSSARDSADGGAGATGPSASRSGCNFVFPFGATISLDKPACALLSSGHASSPLNRPVCAMTETAARGRLIAVSSLAMFHDTYFNNEDNKPLLGVLLALLCSGLALNAIDLRDPDVNEAAHTPDTEALAVRLHSCLQDAEPMPRDFRALFDTSMFSFSTTHMPAVAGLFADLAVKHEPLTLIPPQLEVPLPPLQCTVFPPELEGPPPPGLDLFDLDEEFASEKVRLAHLTNVCADDEADVEFYVRECGTILDIASKLPADQRDAKHILEHVLRTIVNFRMKF